MKRFSFVSLIVCIVIGNMFSQSMNWVYVQPGNDIGSCMSDSDCSQDSLCYALEYIPSVTGTITSYTTGFFVDCVAGANPLFSNSSCIMTDNSGVLDACAGAGLLLMNCSGNSGTTMVEKDVASFIHQICLDMPPGTSLDIVEDMGTMLTVSIDSVGGGGPETDLPSFVTFSASTDDCTMLCNNESCSKSFGLGAGDFVFTNSAGIAIVNGTTLANSGPDVQSFDIYDEANEDCGTSGGADDVTMTFQLINAQDINGNGIIDLLAGTSHSIIQDVSVLSGSLPLGLSADSETSSGDIRGYSIVVDFASHLEILASQLTVSMSEINSANSIYESASLVFFDQSNVPYGSAGYLGYYNSTTDLSGACGPTPVGTPWSMTGTGVFVADATNTVDLTDPCNPTSSGINGPNDTALVNAEMDAGLNATDKVGGFLFTVYVEDVAAPDELDDGSATPPDDGIIANANTITISSALSGLVGYDIAGCVFPSALPVELSYFKASQHGQESLLDWATYSEIDNDFFVIEWGTNGLDFTEIGRIEGGGDQSQLSEYSFIHSNPKSGSNYYRLKQVDFNGQFEYSDIRVLQFESILKNDMHIYPVPSRENLFIELNWEIKDVEMQMTIFDMNGMQFNLPLEFYNDRLKINIQSLPQGAYVLHFTSEGQNFFERFFKL